MLDHFRQFVCAVAMATWWGGLTFYSLIVVPIGADAFGSTEQGIVTQKVTNWLNTIGLLTLALLLWNVIASGGRLLRVTWTLMAISLFGLALMHLQLDTMVDQATNTVIDGDKFYRLHRVYLLITAVQWLSGAGHIWAQVSGKNWVIDGG